MDRVQVRVFQVAALCAAFAGSVAFSMFWTRDGEHLAALWPANGFLAVALVILPGYWRHICAAICLAANLAFAWWVGDGLVISVVLAVLNVLEAVAIFGLALRFCRIRARRLRANQLMGLLVVCILPVTTVTALLGATAVAGFLDRPFLIAAGDWLLSHGLGLSAVIPTLLILTRPAHLAEFRRPVGEVVGLLVGLALLTAVVFYQSRLPVIFLIFPAITLIAFRIGPAGAAAAGLIVGAIALPLTVMGHGPAMLAHDLEIYDRLHLVQAVVAAALFAGIATGLAVTDRERFGQLLISRERALRTARRRAALAPESIEPN